MFSKNGGKFRDDLVDIYPLVFQSYLPEVWVFFLGGVQMTPNLTFGPVFGSLGLMDSSWTCLKVTKFGIAPDPMDPKFGIFIHIDGVGYFPWIFI